MSRTQAAWSAGLINDWTEFFPTQRRRHKPSSAVRIITGLAVPDYPTFIGCLCHLRSHKQRYIAPQSLCYSCVFLQISLQMSMCK